MSFEPVLKSDIKVIIWLISFRNIFSNLMFKTVFIVVTLVWTCLYLYSFSFFLSASLSSEALKLVDAVWVRGQKAAKHVVFALFYSCLFFAVPWTVHPKNVQVFEENFTCVFRAHTHTYAAVCRGHLLLGTLLTGELQRHSCSQLCATQGGARAEITKHHLSAPIGSHWAHIMPKSVQGARGLALYQFLPPPMTCERKDHR